MWYRICLLYTSLGGINREWVEAVSFEGTDIGTDEMVHIVMRYRLRLPFSVLGINSIPVEQVCSRRMWNGADGGRFGDGGRDGDCLLYTSRPACPEREALAFGQPRLKALLFL